jgi:hypothetical protein
LDRIGSRVWQQRLDILRALAGAKLHDPHVGEPVGHERILTGERLDLVAAFADGNDDASGRLRPSVC